MNQYRLATVVRSLGGVPSRREVVLGLVGAGLGLRAVPPPDDAVAEKKRKRKIKRNAFGCVSVGGYCKNAGQCCSGVCEGKKCRAHDGGTGCRAGLIEDGCGGAVDVTCTTSTGQTGICNTTTGGAGYCIGIAGTSTTVTCKKDADCRGLCGTEAAVCIQCEGSGVCAGPSTGDCNP